MAKKTPRSKQSPKLHMDGRIVVSVSPHTPTFYGNYAEISQTQHDIGLTFVQMPIRLSDADRRDVATTGQIQVEQNVQVIIPSTLLPGLIRALTIQRENYEAAFGKLRDDGAAIQSPKE